MGSITTTIPSRSAPASPDTRLVNQGADPRKRGPRRLCPSGV